MIIIPEIETVVILAPRTGSGSLKRAITDRYEGAMCLYRHAEADLVPAGYDRWRRVGVVRHPVDRLWSLFKFCQPGGNAGSYARFPELWERLHASVARPFEDWLMKNEVTFTNGHDAFGARHWPFFTVAHSLPENRKSQFLYHRPDLGAVDLFRFDAPDTLARDLDVRVVEHFNGTRPEPRPRLSDEAVDHVERFFGWDLSFGGWAVQ